MAVGIGRSISAGFRAANKSWAGIGVVIGVWIVLVIIGRAGIRLTNPPAGWLEQAWSPVAEITPPPPATTTAVTPVPTEKTDLFTEMETTKEAAPAATETAAQPTTETAANATQNREEQIRAGREWTGRAWPVLLVGVLLLVAVSIWLLGGQIGYLAKRVITQQSSLAEFWAAAKRSFVPLLGASGLMVVVVVVAFGVVALLVWGIAILLTNAPIWVSVIWRYLLWGAFIWVAIRLAFWLIAIVVDRAGPVGGLRASLRATRGRWWRLFGLVVLWVLISFGVQLPFGLLQELGNVTGGTLALIAGFISTVAGGIANVYITFASLAAFIRFYEDAKAS